MDVEEVAESEDKTEVEEESEEEEEEEEEEPLENLTVKELKGECNKLGISDKGRKAQLIERIKEAMPVKVAAVEPTEEEYESMDEDEPEEAAAQVEEIVPLESAEVVEAA